MTEAVRSPLRVYATLLSANARKPLLLLEHLGAPYELVEVDVYRGAGRDPEFLALNPLGQVPVIVDGALTLTESNAILLYLAETRGGESLLGASAAERALIHRWLFWEASRWQPVITELLTPAVGHLLVPALVPPPPAPPDWHAGSWIRTVEHLESALSEQPYLVGGAVSIADLSVAAMTTYFAVTECPLARWPHTEAWLQRLRQLPAWRRTQHPMWDGPIPTGGTS